MEVAHFSKLKTSQNPKVKSEMEEMDEIEMDKMEMDEMEMDEMGEAHSASHSKIRPKMRTIG